MALQVAESIMAPEVLRVDIDYTPRIKSWLVDTDGRPFKHTMLVYNEDDVLQYPPMVLLQVQGDEEGLHLGALGWLWGLGSQGVGPTIVDREYVSGEDKLSNGSFTLVDEDDRALYWRTASENSLWVFEDDSAKNAGGYHGDDVLESDEKFPTRPGYSYRAIATGVFGTGRLRVRIIFEGRFSPPNLLVNGNFEDGPDVGWTAADNIDIMPGDGRTGIYGMWIYPIPKPQLVTGTDFSTGWTLGDTMSVHDQFLWIGETPKPQYLPHAGGASGDFTVSPYVQYDNGVPTPGASGYYYRVGPIGQYMPVENPSFESGLAGWVQVAGAWSTSSATHVDGSFSATTGGIAGGALKSLQADAGSGTPLAVDPFTWAVGEEWQFDADVCSGTKGTSDEADGEIHARVYLVDQAYPLNDSHLELVSLDGSDRDAAEWHHGQQRYSVQPDKVAFVPMATIYGHTAGSWYIDNFRATRIRGNNTGIYSADFTAIPNQRYTFRALFVKSDANIGGTVTLRLIFKVAGGVDVEFTTELSQTFGQYRSLSVEGTCPKGYDTMVAAVDGDDIVGGAFRIDDDFLLLEKADNNTDKSTGTPFAVVPAQKYAGGVTIVRLGFVEKGSVRVGVVLSGPSVEDETISQEHTFGEDDESAARVTFDITPKEGYDTATPFVLAKDLAGGDGTNPIVALTAFTVEKSDNNSDSTTGDLITVTPERTYRWTQAVKSGANLQRGTVKLSARCIRAGHDDVVFDSSEMSATNGDWKFIDFSFTPPSGYEEFYPSIIGTDVEGAFWYLDDGEIRDTDTGAVVFDASAIDPVNVSPFVDATAPEGSETVRVVVLNEEGSSDWIVGSVSLKRTGVTPATGNAIVADLLKDPTWHHQLSIAPGTIDAPDVIPYDWVIQNQTDRDALDHLCNVVYDGGLEYHVNATAPATIDVAPSVDLFADHGPASADPITLLPEDIDVQDLDDPEVDVSERATVIRLYGAERQTVSGRPFIITATAAVPGATEYDYNGNPIERVKPVNDGTVDHHGYAQAYATDLALRESEPALNLSVKLSGKDTRPPFDVGSWIYVFHPEAGLEDRANVQEIEGQTVFPRRVRVLSRERALGPSYRIVMRRSDGSTFDLPGVLHSPEDATVLTIGDRLPDWVSDPQGKAPGVEYLRDRASRPR